MLKAKPTRKCKICRQHFERFTMAQKVCRDWKCIEAYAKEVEAKAKQKTAKKERQAYAKKREALKTRADWMKEAQAAFNAWVRERDAEQPCICCGRHFDDKTLTGGIWHAGHYRSTGSAPHLRFHEDNVHKQLAICNNHGAGRAVDYRIGLIARIGLERVEALEADQTPRKWSIDELRAIKQTYRAKLRALKEAKK